MPLNLTGKKKIILLIKILIKQVKHQFIIKTINVFFTTIFHIVKILLKINIINLT